MLRDAIVINVYPSSYTVDLMYRDTEEVVRSVKIAGRVFWPLQINDFVIVGFLGGGPGDPIVLDKVLLRGDPRFTDDPRDVHLIHEVGPLDDAGNITEVTGRVEVKTDKDGNLSLEISGKVGTLNIKALGEEGNINIEGVGTVAITAPGRVTLTTDGDVKIDAGGDIEAKAGGTVKVDGVTVELGSNLAKMLANNLPVCLFTGAKHQLGNTNVKV